MDEWKSEGGVLLPLERKRKARELLSLDIEKRPLEDAVARCLSLYEPGRREPP